MNQYGIGNNLDNVMDWGQMSLWGQPPMASSMQIGGQTIDTSGMDAYQMGRLALDQQGLQLGQNQLEAYRLANAPPSAFQQGVQTFGTVAQGLGNLANIWMGLKGLKLQKEAFKHNKMLTNTNLDNSITDYNRRLTDTLANRALNNGQGEGWVSQQLAKYSAKRSG